MCCTSSPSIFLTLLLPSSSSVSAVRADRLSTAVTLLAAQNSSSRAGVAAGSDDRLVSGVRLRICSRQAGRPVRSFRNAYQQADRETSLCQLEMIPCAQHVGQPAGLLLW